MCGILQVDILRIHVLGREFDALRSAEKFLRAGKAEGRAVATFNVVLADVAN